MLDTRQATTVYSEIFRGFSTLSDVQDGINLGIERERAIELINHAKAHIHKGMELLQEEYGNIIALESMTNGFLQPCDIGD